jgi:hypothetical protein
MTCCALTTTKHKQLLDAKKLHNTCCGETEPVVSLVITLIGDGGLHNVGMAPDDHAEVLTHELIARWLCSAHDQQLCSLSLLSHDCQLIHRNPGAPHEPHPWCELCHLHVILMYAPFLRSQKLVWRSTWPRINAISSQISRTSCRIRQSQMSEIAIAHSVERGHRPVRGGHAARCRSNTRDTPCCGQQGLPHCTCSRSTPLSRLV